MLCFNVSIKSITDPGLCACCGGVFKAPDQTVAIDCVIADRAPKLISDPGYRTCYGAGENEPIDP